MTRFTLGTKILLLIATTIMAVSFVAMLALTAVASSAINQAIRRDVRATGGVLEELLTERSRTLSSQCLLLIQLPALRLEMEFADSASVTDSVREYLPRLSATAALVTDRNGRVMALVGLPAQDLPLASRTAGVAEALSGRSSSSIVAIGNRLMLAVSVPAYVGSYVQGSFTAFSAIDSSLARSLKTAVGTEVVFVSHGQVLGASLSCPAHLVVSSAEPVVLRLNGLPYEAVYTPLPGTPSSAGMGIITMRSYSDESRPYERAWVVLLLILGGVLALALVLGVAVSRSITRPLDGLGRAAQTICRGSWPDRFHVVRTDEIGLLQAAFNEMTDNIQQSRERLLALIDTDPLTGLDNHRRFHEQLAQEAARCQSSGEALTLLLVDLDRFAKFNKSFGHAQGDAALKQVASLIERTAPQLSQTARFGGEEFALLIPRRTITDGEQLAQSIRSEVENLVIVGAGQNRLTVSIGCAEFGVHSTRPEGLVLAAELAVSQAKQLGRNCVCRFDTVPGADSNADPYQLHRFLKDGSLATIQALAAAVDAKDPYTQGHSLNVARLASDLASYIGLPAEEVELIYTTGTLHDVGKIGVPDAILKKPGRLEESERKIMETHPVLGEVIVRKAPPLMSTLPGVRHHHERWDGNGYPDRLEADAIPRIARILALADSFDAMTSDRPYRKGMPVDKALEEIARGSGSQFDPELAGVFVAMVSEMLNSEPQAA